MWYTTGLELNVLDQLFVCALAHQMSLTSTMGLALNKLKVLSSDLCRLIGKAIGAYN